MKAGVEPVQDSDDGNLIRFASPPANSTIEASEEKEEEDEEEEKKNEVY